MTVATAGMDGLVSARICLLKEFDRRGFVFFTSYHSRQGHQLHENPRACLVFHWASMERPVRGQGAVVRETEEEPGADFAAGRRGSQLGAWAPERSRGLPGPG